MQLLKIHKTKYFSINIHNLYINLVILKFLLLLFEFCNIISYICSKLRRIVE